MIAQVASLSTPPSPEEGRVAYNTLISQIQYIMYKNRFKGFTLIELLVVIAIIGILSAVVLASLNSARSKGGDASVQSNLQTIRAQAELVASNSPSGSYAAICADSNIAAAMTAAAGAAGITANAVLDMSVQTSGTQRCHATAAGYAVASSLKSNTADSWCVDSSGTSKKETGVYLGVNSILCP